VPCEIGKRSHARSSDVAPNFLLSHAEAGISEKKQPRVAVSGNYFADLGVKPLLGRLFMSGEGERPGEPLQVILGYSFWRKNFAEDCSIVGKQVQINGKSATVIGVAPEEFHGTFFAFDMDGYLPLSYVLFSTFHRRPV
jgi:hypothetical protein